MSQLKTYEAVTIEEALRSVTRDLGEDIEIVEAVKERRGGVLGFFAREYFVVTARAKPGAAPREPEQAFGDMLVEMASEVADTWEPSRLPVDPPRPQTALEAEALRRSHVPSPPPATTAGTPYSPPPPQAGVIDLRTGRRRPAPMVPLITAADDESAATGGERPIRPSHLRRRLLGDGANAAAEQYVMEVDGPMIDLRDSVPRWSLARLSMLELPDPVLEAIERLDPTRDLEWVQSLSIAISKLKPVPDASISYVVGHGRRSAPELVRGIPEGRIPTALIIDGVRVKVTPDELALSIRSCIR